jgi:two-component sensor histidine kinase
MKALTLSLQRRISAWDRSPGLSLAWRLVLSLLVFRVWDFRFIKSPFRMEDVHPQVLEIAKAQGLDLLDKASWPTWQGHLARSIGFVLVLGLCWWLISRMRRSLTLRLGATVIPALLLGICLIALAYASAKGIQLVRAGYDLPYTYQQFGIPAWGGWVRSPLFQSGVFTQLVAFTLVCVGGAELLLFFFQGRLALLEAQQGALRARLSPHFLFNALNTLHAQIEEDPSAAQETTERLAGLFRQVLEVSEHPTVSLKRELSFVEDYLGIERSRMGSRLTVRVDVTEEAAAAQVPVLALQVLVENAIKHGIEPRVEGGELHIAARLEGRRVHVSVQDTGDGSGCGGNGTGQALSNLRARLAHPKDLVLAPSESGFRASFSFPQV